MATNFNNVRNRNGSHTQSGSRKSEKKSRNYLAVILIIVFVLLCISLIFNIVRYVKTAPEFIAPVQTTETLSYNLPSNFGDIIPNETVGNTTEKVVELGQKAKEAVSSAKSPEAIISNLLALVFTGGSFWLLLLLKKFDQKHYYNASNSFTLISNNRFFYISLVMGIIYAFYIGGWSLVQNINNIGIDILIDKSVFIQKIYAVLSFILLIENYIKVGFSIPITLARTGIFITIGLTLIVVGYIIGMILFYLFVLWVVLKVFFGMIAAENRRREEQDRIDKMANSIVSAFERRWNL